MSAPLPSGAFAGSSWAETARAGSRWPAFSGRESTDILIVGGGIGGISTALNLALLGHRPILVEADEIGAGATGASGGIVAPQLVRHSLDAVVRKLGADHAHQIFSLVAASGNYVFDLARDHTSGCEAEQSGFIAPAMGRESLRRLSDSAQAWEAFRGDVEMISADALRDVAGVHGYAGALLDRSGGMLNPLLYAQGLAQAAVKAGARLFEGSPVASLVRRGAGWEAQLAGGHAVSADRVILAANGGNVTLHPRLRRTVLPLGVCEVTTAPLDPDLRARILPDRQSLTDVEADVFTIRYDRDGGLVTAYPASKRMGDPAIVSSAINARLKAAIPGWRSQPLTHVWQGTAWINISLLPRLVAVDDNMIALQTCNGRGIALNSILGRDLARWLDAPRSERPPLPLEQPRPISGYIFARYAPGLVMAAALLGKRLRQSLSSTPMAQES